MIEEQVLAGACQALDERSRSNADGSFVADETETQPHKGHKATLL